jgi:hypothetical protein
VEQPVEASLAVVEHRVDLRLRELELVTDLDRAGKAAVCREETRPRGRGRNTS